ncbi:uncharacterized protein L203_100952 [Cryptococcus depauperatus CBS 7841]|uniref:mRNA cap guanine-N(7) methyltransferase n=1 Tax=Cryptococcus depauperatus CBS 7841 TaxID=1295531 RepID=A0A1E3I982_9TREE|nr:mRNA cap guanine-N7 methyltransferase [Cryptococcus depauperatus CBS 7841]
MVYDPIRDCDVPSTSVTARASWPNATSSHSHAIHSDREVAETPAPPPQSIRHPSQTAPSYSSSSRSPSSTSMPSNSGNSLRGLLNQSPVQVQRSSGRRSLSVHSDAESHKPKLSNILNDPTPPVNSQLYALPMEPLPATRSVSDGFLAPIPASMGQPSRAMHSRSPNIQTSPSPGYIGRMSLDSTGHSEMRQGSMLPPQQPIHSQIDHDYERRHPIGTLLSSTRSPSISISPKSQYQSLPYSRPGSAAGSNASYGNGHPARQGTLSPVLSSRQVSEDFQRPSSAISNTSASGRKFNDSGMQNHTSSLVHAPPPAAYRGRQVSTPNATSSAYAPRSTPQPPISSSSPSYCTPLHTFGRPIPYNPQQRQSAPSSIRRVIYRDEIDRLKQEAHVNNPLRRRPALERSSDSNYANIIHLESTTTPRGNLPNESDSSYFPSQGQGYSYDDRSVINVSGGPAPYITPTPSGSGLRNQYPPNWEAQTPVGNLPRGYPMSEPGNDNSSGPEYAGRKRGRDDEDEGYNRSRRTVSGPGGASSHMHSHKVAIVANHYNARPDVGVERREESPIIGLRKFNNWIKSVLIGKFAHRPRGKVLDIGCGKGGDLNKWKQARIMLYVGIDLAEQSIQQASDRYRRMGKPGFDGVFFAHDCFSNPISDILSPELQMKSLYDNVTMQFCMHYAFENAAKARMMIENVSRYLRPGGIFIGTIPCAETLLEKLDSLPDDDEELRFGNSCYAVQFTERRHKGVYGHEYRFYLEDAVEDVPEYLVDWDNFVSLAMEYRLKLVYKKPFHEILNEEKDSRDFGPLLGKMGVLNEYGESAMDGDQWEAANLYMGFAFEKT